MIRLWLAKLEAMSRISWSMICKNVPGNKIQTHLLGSKVILRKASDWTGIARLPIYCYRAHWTERYAFGISRGNQSTAPSQ